MITYDDQMNVFRLISENLSKGSSCHAFGGTAMMFYGYKDETKDIDLIFEDMKNRSAFLDSIKKLGFEETSPIKIYIPEKLKDKAKPIMYKRDDYRIDIFLGQIFRTRISQKMKDDIFALHEFRGRSTLLVKVLRKEHIVLLKAITERANDFDDIQTIVGTEKRFDWQYLIDEAIWQHAHGDSWVLLDVEKTIKELQKYLPIQEKYLRQIYAAQKAWKKKKLN